MTRSLNEGLFITFEGIDGAGKTTHSTRLTTYLTELFGSDRVVKTREPGGNLICEDIREIILKYKDQEDYDIYTELLLFMTARYHHFKNKIGVALEAGKIVICDRYIDSTMAYQGYGYQIDREIIDDLHSQIFSLLPENIQNRAIPDITFILDLPEDLYLQRISKRNHTKFEDMGVDIYKRIRNGFIEISKQYSNRCSIINATSTPDQVHSTIIDTLKQKDIL